MADAQQEIATQIEGLFSAFAQGRDVAPGDLLRLEGQMRQGVAQGLLDAEWLRSLLIARAEALLGSAAAQRYRDSADWVIHMQMRRAPVYPSTPK